MPVAKKDVYSKFTLNSEDDIDGSEIKSFLESLVNLGPEGLYPDTDGESNVVMKAADVTCAGVGFFLYPFLIVIRLFAQLALVPLLLFQVLSTYTWVCVTNDIYCRTVFNQYQLGLDKAALGFTFYCCLLITILSTAILRWFPCSKRARLADANHIM